MECAEKQCARGCPDKFRDSEGPEKHQRNADGRDCPDCDVGHQQFLPSSRGRRGASLVTRSIEGPVALSWSPTAMGGFSEESNIDIRLFMAVHLRVPITTSRADSA